MKDGSQDLHLEAKEDMRLWYEIYLARQYQKQALAAYRLANQRVLDLEEKLGIPPSLIFPDDPYGDIL